MTIKAQRSAERVHASYWIYGLPLFRGMLPLIARDRQEEHLLGSPEWAEARWTDVVSHPVFANAGPNFTLCRWYSWDECFEYWDRWHHTRLLIMLYQGLVEGLITSDVQTLTLKLEGLQKNDPGARQTMREAKATAQKVRAKGKNNLHVSILVMLLPNLQRKWRVLHKALAPMKKWHGEQVRSCQSVDGTLK